MSKSDYTDPWHGMKELPADLETWRRERIGDLSEFRREYLNQWPEPEDLVKPNTCGSCRWFKPPSDDPDWRYRRESKRFVGEPVQGTCHNMVATLGAHLLTGRDSRCKHYAPAEQPL